MAQARLQGGPKAVRRLQSLSLRQRIDTEMRVYFFALKYIIWNADGLGFVV